MEKVNDEARPPEVIEPARSYTPAEIKRLIDLPPHVVDKAIAHGPLHSHTAEDGTITVKGADVLTWAAHSRP